MFPGSSKTRRYLETCRANSARSRSQSHPLVLLRQEKVLSLVKLSIEESYGCAISNGSVAGLGRGAGFMRDGHWQFPHLFFVGLFRGLASP